MSNEEDSGWAVEARLMIWEDPSSGLDSGLNYCLATTEFIGKDGLPDECTFASNCNTCENSLYWQSNKTDGENSSEHLSWHRIEMRQMESSSAAIQTIRCS
jgi:hypothetical protein